MADLWQSLLVAGCLMLIVEGIMPFLYPQRWRRMVTVLAQMNDGRMRALGLGSMLLGLVLLLLVH